MPAQIYTPDEKYVGRAFEASSGYLKRETFAAPSAASATSLVNAHAADGSTITTGFTQPVGPARTLQYVSSGTDTTHTVTVNGKDNRGNVIAETITLNGTTVVHGTKAFQSITSVVLPTVASNNISVGADTGLGLTRINAEDSHVYETVDGAQETPTFSYGTAISGNYFKPTTAPNGTHNYVIVYVATEVRND